MVDRPRLLEQALDDIAAGRRTVDECIAYYAADDPELADMLRLAATLPHVCVPHVDAAAMHGVRARVRTRLLATMEQDEPTTETVVTAGAGATVVTFAGRGRLHRRDTMPGWMRVACALAAALLLSLSSGWLVTNAAHSALPESPLYAVKRGEEWVALRTAWSDSRRGEVLASIAAQRLAEASAEAALHHDATVHALLAELDIDMRQLISLTATMTTRHEDTSTVEAALARDLNAEYAAMQSAKGKGLAAFAQDLRASTHAQLAEIQKDNLHVAVPMGEPPATPSANQSANHGGSATPPGQSGAIGTQGAGGSGAPNSQGSGGGSGQGGNGGSGGNSGHGAPHPTPTPARTVTPHTLPPPPPPPSPPRHAIPAAQPNASANQWPASHASATAHANASVYASAVRTANIPGRASTQRQTRSSAQGNESGRGSRSGPGE